jgi:hypothetical protein
MSNISRHLLCLTCLALLLTGCKSTQSTTPPAGVAMMQIKSQSLSTDKRYSYFEIEPDGDLFFGGGYDAITRNTKLVTTLTPDQLKLVQSFISQSNLFTVNVPGKQDRKSAQSIHHELSLTLGKQSRTIQINDDQIPAVSKLHQMLFDYYAKAKYNLPGIGTQSTN